MGVAAAAVTGRSSSARAATARVVVVGGGYGGATAAKYLRMWAPDLHVTLVERDATFVSCPLSNRVLAGLCRLDDLTRSYERLHAHWGVALIHDEAIAIDPDKRHVRLASGAALPYDALILSPGLDLMLDAVPGLKAADASGIVLHAWKAGPQTMALRKQLEAMPDGGVYAIALPKAPYRCPPGPYERACQVAWYFKTQKPKSKVLILDANEKVQSKEALFTRVWEQMYAGIVDYRPNSTLIEVDAGTKTAKLEFEDVRADVLNVVPPQRAGQIAAGAGLITANDKWCEVDFLTFESTVKKDIYVLGDAVLAAPAMPKSGHMANQHGKACAAAIIARLHDQPVDPAPMLSNTCYSFVSDKDAIHIASVHQYDVAQKTFLPVAGSAGVSSAPSAREGEYAQAWGKNIWADMLD
ncbi:MAG TPA: NAD(P)/FAD-dependent oxidoreductase [Burkholderiales bacterium]|nr:NAD(P)/FAD-dependent oxidoreductase [Burkholderiales bacterium]